MDERFKYCLESEISFAQRKFPGNKYLLAALTEEVGELHQAMIDHSRAKASCAEIFAEAVQVAAMAYRVAMEGDEAFPYQFVHESYQQFNCNKD